MLRDTVVQDRRQHWHSARHEMLDGMLKLVQNYLPVYGYSKRRVQEFAHTASFEQLSMRAPEFFNSVIAQSGAIDIDAFPSLKAMSYTAFYKFYTDQSRKPRASDVFDIILAATVPYVDVVFTEAHQAETLKKVKSVDPFIEHVKVSTLRTLR